MSIGHYIKEIGRGKDGARALSREQAADLLGQVLDGSVTDLEVGAFCLAMRIKGETAQEMAGFLDAVRSRAALVPAGAIPTVVIPSYNGARKLPLLTPLLALLLMLPPEALTARSVQALLADLTRKAQLQGVKA
jgi:anthranilate phosphoribosyltransferase